MFKLKRRFSKKLKKEETLKRMKKVRQVDSNNLRSLIEQKLKWAIQEREKGLKLIKDTKIQIYKLEGILIFIQDLLKPPEKKKEEK